MPIVRQALLQMDHALRTCGSQHMLAIGPFDPETRPARHLIAQILELVIRIALRTVHCEHTPALRAAKGSMLEVMIEDQNVARCGIKRQRRHLATRNTPEFRALADVSFQLFGISLAEPVAARNDPQCSGLTGQPVKIEGNLDVPDSAASTVAVGVPAGV